MPVRWTVVRLRRSGEGKNRANDKSVRAVISISIPTPTARSVPNQQVRLKLELELELELQVQVLRISYHRQQPSSSRGVLHPQWERCLQSSVQRSLLVVEVWVQLQRLVSFRPYQPRQWLLFSEHAEPGTIQSVGPMY